MIFYNKEDELKFNESLINYIPNKHHDNRVSVANSQGLIFHCIDIFRTNNGWYQFECGHVKSISRGDVKRGKFTCKECTTVKKYKECCEKIGLEYIDRYIEKEQSMLIVKCKVCDTIHHKRASSITHHESIICEVCRIDRWRQEAKESGFEYIEQIDVSRGKYRCLECGKENVKWFTDIRNKEVACECKREKQLKQFNYEAFQRGFKLLSKEPNENNMYEYECLDCGEVNTYQIGAMRIGNIRCRSEDCNIENKSKGQMDVEKVLRNNYTYEIRNEITFNDLYGFFGAKLRYDIGLYRNKKLICLIEYDGIRHFEVTSHPDDNINKLFHRQLYDHMKNQYCIVKGIKLLRVNCYDYSNNTWKEKLINFMEELENEKVA